MAPWPARRRFDPIAAGAAPLVAVGLVLLARAADEEAYFQVTEEALRRAAGSLHDMVVAAAVLGAATLVLVARKHRWTAVAVAAPGVACVGARLLANSDNTLFPMIALVLTAPFAIAGAVRAAFPPALDKGGEWQRPRPPGAG